MTGPVRAALYLRVSTTRQAEVDLSIPDQQAQTSAYCARRGWRVVAEYVEAGASAMDDHRPEFQRMIERACDDDRPIDLIVVHSFSRFFRDAFGLEMYVRKFAKHGVRLVSITQELGRAIWRRLGSQNTDQSCFCRPLALQPTRVQVWPGQRRK